MGCLCSKASAKDVDHSHARETEISNVLHQSISLKNSTNKLASLAELFITNQFESFSLFHCPASEELLKRCWIYKRGHLVRTWKKRYCVLDKNDINYYVKSSADPPYGKKLKGKVALLGAVCIDRESNDGKNIEVEIYGNVGEKDLFFSVENTEEGQSFVRILQWSIRKSTLTMLARNIKSVSSSGKKDKSNQLKYTCTQWKENQNLLFQASIEKLLSPQLYYMLLTEPTGQIVMKPCILKLWNIFGEDYIPNIHTEASHMGIGWHVIYPNDIEQYNGKGLPFFNNLMRFISFDDIIDMTFQYVDDTANEWLKKNINYLHHHGNFSTSDNNTSANNSSKKQKKENEHPLNEDNIYMIITLLSKYDYKIQILACCLHDYNDCLLAIQNILLFIQARTKLIQANTSSQLNEGQSSRKSSANSMSIHQSSAAKAASLVLDQSK